jgi:hypothetical protein
LCQGCMPETKGTADRLWRPRRLFYWRTYDAAAFDEWSTYRKTQCRPVARSLRWRPAMVAQDAYDTLDQVLSLGVVNDAGMCLECGGQRRRLQCKCPRTLDDPERVENPNRLPIIAA